MGPCDPGFREKLNDMESRLVKKGRTCLKGNTELGMQGCLVYTRELYYAA